LAPSLDEQIQVFDFNRKKSLQDETRDFQFSIGTPAVCVAQHPYLDYVVIGTMNNNVVVAGSC
jgi:hypothetical protein